MKVSVVLPARNEEKLIKDTVLDIVQYLKKKKHSFEIIVVVNGSFDKTEEIVDDLSKRYKQIKRLKSKPGYGFALRRGLREVRGEYIVVFNVDFYDLKLIDLVDIDMYGKDLIIGSKRAHWSQDNRAFKRKLVSMLFNWYLRIIYGLKGSDTHGIKIMKKNVLKKILSKCKTVSGIFDTEFVIRAQRSGLNILELPVQVAEKRPNRFGLKRLLDTPSDLVNLYSALMPKPRKKDSYSKKLSAKTILTLVILIGLILIVYFPASQINFHWIDDGWMVQHVRSLLNNFLNLNFGEAWNILVEENIGRFRPIFWLWKALVNLFAGNNAGMHYLFRFVLIGGTALTIFKILLEATKSRLVGFYAASLFLLHPLNTENWYRLGPQEPLLGFFVVLSLYFLIKRRKLFLSVLFLFLAFFSKETALALVPAVIIYFAANWAIKKKSDTYVLRYILYSLLFLAISLLITFSIRSGYSEFYEFNLQASILRFKGYLGLVQTTTPFVALFSALYAFKLLKSFCRGIKKQQVESVMLSLLFFSVAIMFLLVQSPWVYVIGRYTLPAMIGVVLFLGNELHQAQAYIKKKNLYVGHVIIFLFFVYYSFFVFSNMMKAYSFGMRVSFSTNSVQKMMEYVATNVDRDAKVFLNLKKTGGTYEHFREIDRQLDIFYNRDDIELNYLELKNDDEGKYYIASGASFYHNFIEEEKLSSSRELSFIGEIKPSGRELILTTPVNMVKQTIKKLVAVIMRGEKFTGEGIYTYHYKYGEWKLYSSGYTEGSSH